MKKATTRKARNSVKGVPVWRTISWHRAQQRQGRSYVESAKAAGCSKSALQWWRSAFGLIDLHESEKQIRTRAHATYANPKWLAAKLQAYSSIQEFCRGERLHHSTVRKWIQRLGIPIPSHYLLPDPLVNPDIRALLYSTILNPAWFSRRVRRGESDIAICMQVNALTAARGIKWYCYPWRVARARRARGFLPWVKYETGERVAPRSGFGVWLKRRRKTLARALKPKEWQLLRVLYMNQRLKSMTVVAREQGCTRAAIHSRRVRAMEKIQALHPIPLEFYGVAFHWRNVKGHARKVAAATRKREKWSVQYAKD